MQANFYRCSAGKICENSACGRPQAVLAFLGCVYTQPVLAIRGKLPVGSLRVLGCVNRMPKINMEVFGLN